jgi:osmotically-inducible protein OsmY
MKDKTLIIIDDLALTYGGEIVTRATVRLYGVDVTPSRQKIGVEIDEMQATLQLSESDEMSVDCPDLEDWLIGKFAEETGRA